METVAALLGPTGCVFQCARIKIGFPLKAPAYFPVSHSLLEKGGEKEKNGEKEKRFRKGSNVSTLLRTISRISNSAERRKDFFSPSRLPSISVFNSARSQSRVYFAGLNPGAFKKKNSEESLLR